jgi:hypothetical protein
MQSACRALLKRQYHRSCNWISDAETSP